MKQMYPANNAAQGRLHTLGLHLDGFGRLIMSCFARFSLMMIQCHLSRQRPSRLMVTLTYKTLWTSGGPYVPGHCSMKHITWTPTVSDPHCGDYAYQPINVTTLAKYNESAARINAESYAQAAMAIYVQSKFDLLQPPVPEQGEPLYDLAEIELDAPPDGWVSPVSVESPTFNPAGPGIQSLSDIGNLTVDGPA
jgi:hypothetical protein